MIQTAPAASCVPHVFDSWNCALAEMEIDVSSRPPEFVIVTVCAEESWPSGVGGKESDAGLRTSMGGEAPVPPSSTDCVPAPSVKVSRPEAGPASVGANSTANWQLEFGTRLVVPQELLETTNGGVMTTLPMGIAAAPLLVAVI